MRTYSERVTARDARAAARREVAEFLASRRARITPQESGLPPAIGRRRVAGLRREEVALLAGVSVEYYARLERGRVGAVSEGVLESLAQVLRLDDVERAHLAELVRTTGGGASENPGGPGEVRSDLSDLLDLMPDAAAFVRNARLDLLAANPLARALYAHVFDTAAAGAPGAVPNLARSLFLDPRSRAFYRHWPRLADNAVGGLRAEAARSRADRDLADLIEQLSERSEEFRTRWTGHVVDHYRSGDQHFRHELVGDLTLRYEALDVVADPGLTLLVYHAEPGSPSAAALARLTP